MALSRTLPLCATLATLAGALAAAACLVATGGAEALPATAVLPPISLESEMPLLRSLSEALARLARPGPSGPADRLESLDARMLHDLGLDVSELGSVQAEHRGEAMLSRRRILVAGRHG